MAELVLQHFLCRPFHC